METLKSFSLGQETNRVAVTGDEQFDGNAPAPCCHLLRENHDSAVSVCAVEFMSFPLEPVGAFVGFIRPLIISNPTKSLFDFFPKSKRKSLFEVRRCVEGHFTSLSYIISRKALSEKGLDPPWIKA